jgi:hypothetical protein
MYKYPNTKIHNHDYVIVFDDESGFLKELPFDPIDMVADWDPMAAMITGQRLKDGKIPQNHIDTREGLYEFYRSFCEQKGFYEILSLTSSEFHYLPWSDGYVVKTWLLYSSLYRDWVEAIRKNGGIYKHRWGDNELFSLFYQIHGHCEIDNLRIVEDGYLKQDLFRHIQNIAPGVKDNDR